MLQTLARCRIQCGSESCLDLPHGVVQRIFCTVFSANVGAIDPTLVTGRAGVPLGIELFRQLGVAHVVDTDVPVKQGSGG